MRHDISKEARMLYALNTPKTFPKLVRMFVDYAPSAECKNPETYGEICVKCGECGRTFDENGVMEKEVESE